MTEASEPPARAGGVTSVLIADDDARVRHALRALIDCEPGVVVVGEAGCVKNVLACDSVLQPSVILLDILQSRLEEGLALIRALSQERGRPVVAISMRGGLREAALAAGARAFVEKGAAPELVLSTLLAAAGHDPTAV